MDKSGQAMTLHQLGVLYQNWGRLKESIQLYWQAAILREELGDTRHQTLALNNLAIVLMDLGRLAEAREIASRAAQLEASFGYATEPWKTCDLLQNIETLAGRPDAAAAARSRAMDLYAAYRRDGGEPQLAWTRWIAAVGRTLQEEDVEAARSLIPPPDQFEERLLPAREALLALIEGSRDPALARDPGLDSASAVELSLLLASLAGSPPR